MDSPTSSSSNSPAIKILLVALVLGAIIIFCSICSSLSSSLYYFTKSSTTTDSLVDDAIPPTDPVTDPIVEPVPVDPGTAGPDDFVYPENPGEPLIDGSGNPVPPESAEKYVILYDGDKYQGKLGTIKKAGKYDFKGDLSKLNDDISSIQIKGFTVTLYEDTGYRNKITSINKSVDSLGKWKNRVSSIEVK